MEIVEKKGYCQVKTHLCCVLCSIKLRLAYSVKGAGHVDGLSALQSLHGLDSSSFASQQTKPLLHMRHV